MGIKWDTPHTGRAHCLVCGQSLTKFASLSVSRVFGRKEQPRCPKQQQGLLGAPGASPNPHDFSLLSIWVQGPSLSRKKKNPPKEALYTSAITYHVLIWEPSLLLVCSWEGQHLTAQNSHDHLTADSHKRSVNARCVQNSRLRVLENEILQGKEKHRDRAS